MHKFYLYFLLLIFKISIAFSQNDTSGLVPVFNVYNLSEVNSKGLDFCPVVYEDKLVFVSEREIDYINYGERGLKRVPYLSIQYSKIKSEKDTLRYSMPRVFSNRISQLNFNGPICFNKEGNYAIFIRLVYYKKDKEKIYRPQLFSAIKENLPAGRQGGKWKEIQLLNINGSALPAGRQGSLTTEFSFGHPTLSADGESLYFSSDMEGGYGGKDIYVSRREQPPSGSPQGVGAPVRKITNGEGQGGVWWGEPVNLGPEINTAGNEMFPFIYQDSLLYYSSDGHEGFGGLDLFFAGRIDGDWIFVSNLGATINSGFDDFGIFLNDDGNSGYFSSNRTGGMGGDDIYSFTIKWILPEKGKTLAGQFVYKTLPHKMAQGLKIYLLNDEGEIVYTTTTDEKGDFVFENLPYDQNFIVKIDEQDQGLVLLILDENNNVIDEMTSDIRGEFVYKKLSYKQFGGLAFLYASDAELDDGEITKSLTGQFMYRTLPGDNPEYSGLKVFLVNDEGEILFTAVADERGRFVFENLPFDQNYIIKTEKYDPDIKLLILKDEDIVAELTSNERGTFLYVKLSHEVVEDLALLDAKDTSILISEVDLSFSRNIEPSLDVNEEDVGVISEDNESVFIFNKLKPDESGPLSLMEEANPGFCPGTFDLEIEEASDCIDIAIEELLKETEEVGSGSETEKSYQIYFDVNSSYLTKEAILVLDKIVLNFNNQPQLKLEVKAYTDARADVNYNLWVSERRAKRILWYLALKGVDTHRMTGKGYGESNPIVNCTDCTEEQHRLNRRAELKIFE